LCFDRPYPLLFVIYTNGVPQLESCTKDRKRWKCKGQCGVRYNVLSSPLYPRLMFDLFSVTTPCNTVGRHHRFRRTYCSCLQGRRLNFNSQLQNRTVPSPFTFLPSYQSHTSRSEVLTTVIPKNEVLWAVTLC